MSRLTTIRSARLEDVKNIATIHVRTWQCAYRVLVPDEMLKSLSIEQKEKMWKQKVIQPSPRAQIFVALQENKVVGFCSVGPCRDEDADETVGELYAIYISPTDSGKGTGTQLIQQAVKFFQEQNFKKATLWVLTDNEKGRHFYEKNGWKPDGKTKVDKRDEVELKETRYSIDL